jgi:hypothetical protein
MGAVVFVFVAVGYQSRAQSNAGHDIRPADLNTLHRATPATVEQLLGPPDERMADGAYTYRQVRIGRPRSETLTIRFTDGVVTRICRSDAS